MPYSTSVQTQVEDLELESELARELRKSLSVPGAAVEVQLVYFMQKSQTTRCG